MCRKIILSLIFALLLVVFLPVEVSAQLCSDGQIRRDNGYCLDGEVQAYVCPTCPDCGNFSVCCVTLQPCLCKNSCTAYTEPEQFGICTANSCPAAGLTPDSCQTCVDNGPYMPGTYEINPSQIVNGVCGGDNGNNNLCSNPIPACTSGTLSNVNVGPVITSWDCVGSCTGTTAHCTSSKQDPIVNNYWSNYSEWGSCSVACGDGTMYRTSTCTAGTSCGLASCSVGTTKIESGSCNMGCCSTPPTDGVCGIANAVSTNIQPNDNLCSVGTATEVSLINDVYTWKCLGVNGACMSDIAHDAVCSAERNNPPEFVSLEIRNSSDTVINADSGNRNHICDTRFVLRQVKFVVKVNDVDGNISSVSLNLNNNTYTTTSITDGEAVFSLTFNTSDPSNLSNINVKVDDDTDLTSGWVDTGRQFKIWNCKVPISGSVYSGNVVVFDQIDCNSSANFVTKISTTAPYSLRYFDADFGVYKDMSVSNPDYNQGSNYLSWGSKYTPIFSNMDSQTPKMKVPGQNGCSSLISLNDESVLNPYDSNPSLAINFSTILAQKQWYQLVGGGMAARNSIVNSVPGSCSGTCSPFVSLATANIASGLVAAKTIDKGAGAYSSQNTGIVRNIIASDYSYKYFYNEYFTKYGLGKIYNSNTSMSQIIADVGGTGLVFVDGKLNIDVDNTVSIGGYLMIITKGGIDVSSNVNNSSGIFVTDGDFVASGTSDNALSIFGAVYAKDNVKLSRAYTNPLDNNKNPSVVINYRPDMLFSIPSSITKTLTTWKEGR